MEKIYYKNAAEKMEKPKIQKNQKLILKCWESEDKDVWSKISIAKTRFDVWPIFANFRDRFFSLAVKSEIVFLETARLLDTADGALSPLSRHLRVKVEENPCT